ncbi:carboxypeptidase-like regulatory domain-containing protein [Hymenobacter rubripertinctus]|uniref:carboxypeptidase-like regulatory domain-containing protein n=1 Tax=Hymenobacter rubripertinctus TaxID=2029981 RepID=UPI0016007287|nr:carboxypeptidase-like regulatory domain-containing protein [Hymenobacter rubripertinctus]
MSSLPAASTSTVYAPVFYCRPAYLGLSAQLAVTAVGRAAQPFTGAVFSQQGLPLPGATVTVAGPRQVPVIVNAEGFFLLQLPAGLPVQLVVAYPGFASQQITLRAPEAEKNLVVTLVPVAPDPGQASWSRRGRQRRG